MQSEVAQLPISHRLWAWFETNRKPTLIGILIAALVGLVIWVVVWRQQEKRVAAGDAVSDVAARLMSGTPRSELAGAYLKVAANYPNSSPGARALLLAAASLFADGKFNEAQAQFEKFTREYRDTPFTGQALLGVAASLDAQGKAEAAITAYKNLVDRHPSDIVVPQAKFALARLYEAQGKPELAKDLFQDVERGSPFSSLGNEAGMRLEELIAKYPALAPAPPPPSTNSPLKLLQKQ
ncbi:MAG TPA: tetratricopeptide repeat protein [Candidatus Limnocylindrales bacterium]|jgi:TolA-binding protein|nr:tetratricopeptide repeat protein [Candidatus Limnocylindrales bacterium]